MRECFLAVAAQARMAAGYVAKAIWLAVRCKPEVKKKQKNSPIVQTGDGREPGCFNIAYSQMCSTHFKKKVLWNFCLVALKHISGRVLTLARCVLQF